MTKIILRIIIGIALTTSISFGDSLNPKNILLQPLKYQEVFTEFSYVY